MEAFMSTMLDHLLITKGPRAGEEIILENLPLTIGRMKPADAVIDVGSISRNHARISRTASGYIIEDLGSSNGTFVNGERVQLQAKRQIADNDTIRLGSDVELRLVIASVESANATIIEKPVDSNKTISMAPADAPVDTPVAEPASDSSNRTMAMQAPPDAGTSNKTMAMQAPVVSTPASTPPPQLVVNESGQEAKIYTLTASRIRIGRQADNDVVLNNRFVSRAHAELEKRGNDYWLIPSSNLSNSLILDGQPVMEPTRLRHGAKIRIGGYAPGEVVALDFLSPLSESGLGSQQSIQFTENRLMKIGRNKDNDIVIPAPTVSQYHAEVEKIGKRFRLRDLRSSNGTFVNGKAISGETWVQPGDAIQIGPYRFVVDEHEFAQFDQSEGGVRIDVVGLNKWVNGNKLNILQDISLVFQPKEFIVVVGQSGGGKSTLVDAIAGYRPATHGRVVVNGTIDVYKEFDAIRSTIGFVPQKDIIHMELTVFQALDYAARLRMPADTTVAERHKRIEEVMEDLDLAHRRDTTISRLSGGQQKRVSIGVELITKPGLFFLDEPTSGLDPGMETELMRLMRRLADQGRTVVMITHATKNVMLADKVVFLARGGYLSWFGPPEEALAYFDQYRSERERRASPMEFDNIYTLLDQPELGSAPDWASRYKNDPAYKKYIAEPLIGQSSAPAKTAAKPQKRKAASAIRQFFILSDRNIKIMTRDKFSLILLILVAPLMASLDFVLSSGVGRAPTSFNNGTFNEMITTLISITNTSVLVGGLAMMRELVKERDIYKRERLVNLQLSSYILSKVWIAFVLAIYQAACFTVFRYLAFDMPGGSEEFVFFFVTEFLLVLSGTMVGLFCSALAPNGNAAPLLLILFIIPQMVLSGALVQLPETATAIAPMRWAFQSFIGISGVGSDVAGDACWRDLTKEQRDDLTLDQKNAQCKCMGENALYEKNCNFPGLGKYYTDALDTPDPSKPVDPGPQPQEPDLPPAPASPTGEEANNVLALQKYLNDSGDYNNKATELQDEYKKEIDVWQDKQEIYKDDLKTYQVDITDLKVKRATAVGSAESTVERFKDQYGWTFVDKTDREAYLQMLIKTWIAQMIICLVLFIGTIIMQKRAEAS
jgi:ABC-type multidrug transport system ATPase subunit/pSer/pThr/pTyr-binding forkhead associated (FHA) protein